MNKKVINNKGFSLLELIIGLAISAVIIVAVFSFVLVGADSYKKTSRVTNIQQEVSFVDNLIGEAIRESSQAEVTIIKYKTAASNGDIQLNTTDKVFYYDDSDGSLYVYEKHPGVNYAANDSENIVSEYIPDFNVAFMTDGVTDPTDASFITNGTDYDEIRAGTKLVRVKAEFEYKTKEMSSDVTYKIRN